MFARHLLLKTMMPSVTQTLLGTETSSALLLFPSESKWLTPLPSFLQCCNVHATCSSTQVKPQPSTLAQTMSKVFTAPNAQNLLCVKHQHLQKKIDRFYHIYTGMKGSRECCMHHPRKRIQYKLNGAHCHQPARMLSFSPKAILEASPPSFQPYLRLIRFDKPIGKLLFSTSLSKHKAVFLTEIMYNNYYLKFNVDRLFAFKVPCCCSGHALGALLWQRFLAAYLMLDS